MTRLMDCKWQEHVGCPKEYYCLGSLPLRVDPLDERSPKFIDNTTHVYFFGDRWVLVTSIRYAGELSLYEQEIV